MPKAPALRMISWFAKTWCARPRRRYSTPDGTTVADDHMVDQGLGDDGQIVLASEVAPRGAPALTLADVDRRDRRAVEFGSADIVVSSDARRPRCGDEVMRQVVGIRRAGDVHRPVLDPSEHRRNVIPAPAGQLPAVVVQIAALDPAHGVHRTATAEDPTARLRDAPVGATGLRVGLVRPVQRRPVLHGREQRRPDRESSVRATGFDQQHSRRRLAAVVPPSAQPAEPAPTTMKSKPLMAFVMQRTIRSPRRVSIGQYA